MVILQSQSTPCFSIKGHGLYPSMTPGTLMISTASGRAGIDSGIPGSLPISANFTKKVEIGRMRLSKK